MDLAVVSPAGAHRAAALLLGGVSRQNIVAKVGVIQVIVTLFPLLSQGSGWNSYRWSLGNGSCGGTKKPFL